MPGNRVRGGFPTKYFILFFTTVLVLVLDQWTKKLIHTQFRWGESVPVLDSIFSLTYVRNQGAAFGMLHRAPAWFRDPFFIVIPVIALFVIVFLLSRLNNRQRWTATALSLILGGALGNLIDRLRFGYVIDFLDFHWKEIYHWPAFNVADSCIVVGVSIMFLQSLLGSRFDAHGGGLASTPRGR
jgi:signal peptidase II